MSSIISRLSNLSITPARLVSSQEQRAQPQAFLLVLSSNCLVKALGYCTLAETAGFGRINKAFAAIFHPQHADRAATNVLLEQITGCTTLSSLKDLRSQSKRLKALNAPHPEGKEWTISEVLKRYNLKKIDFSQEKLSVKDFEELMDAFEEAALHKPFDLHHLDLGKNRVAQGFLVPLLENSHRLQHVCLETTLEAYIYLLEHFSKSEQANVLLHFNVENEIYVMQERLWKFIQNQSKLEYYIIPNSLSEYALMHIIGLLANSCPNLGNLTIRSLLDLVRNEILHFAETHPRLHTVDFRHWGHKWPQYAGELLRQMGKSCKNITALRFDDYSNIQSKIDDKVMEAAFEACPQLESFFLTNAPLVTDRFVEQIPRRWPHLKELNLSGCSGASANALYYVGSVIRSLPRDRIDRMRRLPAAVTCHIFSFADFHSMGSLATVSKAFHSYVIKARKQRKSLESMEGFRRELCSILETLPSEKGGMSVVQARSAGQHLQNFVFNPKKLFEFIQSLSASERIALITRLEDLYVGIQSAVVHEAMVPILQLLGKRAAQITTLDIFPFGTQVINFELLRTLCPNLSKINLQTTAVTDKQLAQIGIGCPNLTSIDLSGCAAITDEGILALVKGCKKLETINLQGTSIKDKGVMAIADNCPELTSLNLHECKVEDRAIILYVAKRCPSLRYLQVHYNISCESRLDLLISYPQVTDIDLSFDIIERFRRALSYTPVSPFGKLVSAILQRKPRADIQKLLNEQDSCFDKDRFLALIQPDKDGHEFSLYDVSYERIIQSTVNYLLDLAMEGSKKDRIIELFCSLGNAHIVSKPDHKQLIISAFYHNSICLADAFNIASTT